MESKNKMIRYREIRMQNQLWICTTYTNDVKTHILTFVNAKFVCGQVKKELKSFENMID